jgi:hypothetical protein
LVPAGAPGGAPARPLGVGEFWSFYQMAFCGQSGSEPTSPMTADHFDIELCKKVRKVVRELAADKSKAELVYYEWMIAWMLHQRSFAVSAERPTARQAIARLQSFLDAVEKACAAADGINGLAFEALNTVKQRRKLVWRRGASDWSFIDPGEFGRAIDAQYPDLVEAVKDAIAELQQTPKANRSPGRRPKDYPLKLAEFLAGSYEGITGKPPGSGRAGTRFGRFVRDIFEAARIPADPGHYAKVAATRHRRGKSGENVTGISWHYRP